MHFMTANSIKAATVVYLLVSLFHLCAIYCLVLGC
jgi:hypothetical protein